MLLFFPENIIIVVFLKQLGFSYVNVPCPRQVILCTDKLFWNLNLPLVMFRGWFKISGSRTWFYLFSYEACEEDLTGPI
jgi:hypothetical protein